ncbi:MAG: hypothetical protein D6798_14805, partial [Deltaproteobacteria bacterium]
MMSPRWWRRARHRTLERATGVVGALSMSLACSGCGSPPVPTGRYSAVGGMGPDGRSLYVAGGGSSDGVLSDAWRFDLATRTWERLGDLPRPMLRGTATLVDRDLWVFAGEDGDFHDTADLWRWNLDTDTWESIDAIGDWPAPRKKHQAVAVDGQVLVHGGQQNDGDPDVVLGDLWTWDPIQRRWTEQLGKGGPAGSWRQGMATDPDTGTVWLQGGYDGDDVRTDWLWSLDIDTWTWRRQLWTGDGPPPRASHVVTAFSGELRGGRGSWLAVWGGHATDADAWLFDPQAGTWTDLPAEGEHPLPRDAQVSGLAADGRSLVIACGDPASDTVPDFVCDVWSLDLVTGAWTRLAADPE